MDKDFKAIWLSINVFSVYMVLMGLVLLLVPKQILPVFDLPTEGEIWIRLLGFVLLCSSIYYLGAARLKFIPFAKWSVYTRAAAPVLVIILIVLRIAPIQIVSFGIIDGLGSLWTYLMLKKAGIYDK